MVTMCNRRVAARQEQALELVSLDIPDVKRIIPRRFRDERGWFSESYSARAFAEHGLELTFVQDNHSYSHVRGAVRGLHFQAPPHAQAKLVRVTRGRVRDVAVDIRRGSPTYGRWVSADLSAEGGEQILVPEGFLHGFATLEPDCEVQYKVTKDYAKQAEGGVLWSDAALAIDWGVASSDAVLSEKDAAAMRFADFQSPFVWQG